MPEAEPNPGAKAAWRTERAPRKSTLDEQPVRGGVRGAPHCLGGWERRRQLRRGVRQGLTKQGQTKQGLTKQGLTKQGLTKQGQTKQGLATGRRAC